jgi:anti-sigma regulatory factor (Ser/Thr protein kinase)
MSEWTRYEAILNVAFAEEPATFLCPYDARRLPTGVIADARRTHPELCSGAEVAASRDFVDVSRFVRELDGEAFAEPTGPATECRIAGDLRPAREFIFERARAAGVSGKALPDAFLAVQEVAANVVAHGPGHGTIRSWVDRRELIYEVHDDGNRIGDPLVGQLASEPALASEPRGLWMARLLSDLVEVRAGDRGLVVRLHVSLV